MIPNDIQEQIQKVKELKVVNTNKTKYKFDSKTNTLYIPISETNFSNMFSGCSFQSVDLDIDNHIKHASYMFSDCIYLKNIVFTKKLNLSEVNSLCGLFSHCFCLRHFDFKDFILSNKLECLTYIFYGCACLYEVNFGNNFPSENIKNMDFAFYDCMGLKKIYWGERQPFNNLECMNAAFIKCNKLKELDLRGVDFNELTESENAFLVTSDDLKVFVNNTFRENMF